MRRTRVPAAAVAIALGITTVAAHDDGHGRHGHGAHEHGVAALTIVVDGAILQIELESPSMNLIGFEHRPRTGTQREALGSAVEALRDGPRLFSFGPAGARCVQQRATVLSTLLDDDEDDEAHHEGGHGHDDAHDRDPDDHADIFAAWRFECAGAGLAEIDMRGLFSRFPGTERLRVQAVTGQGQTARELTPASSRLRW